MCNTTGKVILNEKYYEKIVKIKKKNIYLKV
jgi:hypothetical protein